MATPRQPQTENGNLGTRLPWQAVVAVLAAFIVGLFPFVIAQSRYTTKDETAVIRNTQIDVLQRLAEVEAHLSLIEQNTAAIADNAAHIAELERQLATLAAQVQSLLPPPG